MKNTPNASLINIEAIWMDIKDPFEKLLWAVLSVIITQTSKSSTTRHDHMMDTRKTHSIFQHISTRAIRNKSI